MSRNQIPNPPGYTASSSRDVAAKVSSTVDPLEAQADSEATPQTVAAQAQKSNQLRIRRAWDLAFSYVSQVPCHRADRKTSKESSDAGNDALLFRLWDPNLFTRDDLHAPHWTHHGRDRDLQV